MKFITFEELNNCLYANLGRIPRDVDLVVGIPRSGTMVANLLALYLNLPFLDVPSFCDKKDPASGNTRKCRNWIRNSQEAKKILLVDDSISSGRAMKEAVSKLRGSGYEGQIVTLAVYALAVTCKMVDLYFKRCEQPRMFEWNYMHHWALEYTCVDMDGVLCEDPRFLENDDGKRYRQFLQEAKPKFLPTQKVGAIVTCRLEKYRQETENWLKRYGVEYGELIMLDLECGRDRWKEGFSHGKFKGEIYKQSNFLFFLESDYRQALEICRCSGKEVFSIENRQLIRPENLASRLLVLKSNWRITWKRVVKKLMNKLDYVK